jgi:hypothetical protein
MNMKTWMATILFFTGCWLLSAQELTGPQIIEKVNDLLNPETMWAQSEMTIQTSSGQERTFVYESWSKNHGEKNLIRYLKPVRVKDQATLMLNYADDIWMFFPRTNRVRKLATHAKKQKMEGSDFSYEDMGAGNSFVNDYTSKRIKDQKVEGQPCFQVDMIKKPDTDVSYSRLVMFVRQDNFVPVIVDYYDENQPDRKIKTLKQSDIQVIDQIPTAIKIVMTNDLDNSQTRMEMLEVKYNLPLKDEMFTERGMKQ